MAHESRVSGRERPLLCGVSCGIGAVELVGNERRDVGYVVGAMEVGAPRTLLVELTRLAADRSPCVFEIDPATEANLGAPAQRERLAKLLKRVTVYAHSSNPPALPRSIVLPGKDVPILQAAITAGATVLLTGDVTHFGRYYGKTFGGVRILRPAVFIREQSGNA